MPILGQLYENTAAMVLASDILENSGKHTWNFVCMGICILSNERLACRILR